MKLRTFRAQTMAAALAQVKKQYGRDAVILNTRTLTKGGVFGLGSRLCVEITAAPHPEGLPDETKRDSVGGRSGLIRRTDGAAAPMSMTGKPVIPAADTLLAELGALKDSVSHLVRETRRSHAGHLPDALFETYQQLVENEVAEQIAHELIDKVRQQLTPADLVRPEMIRACLAEAMLPMLPTAGGIHLPRAATPRVIALIGPTGVGKTTTIAKLAANFSLRQNRRVGLVTIDTYRIAAVEQLKTYAQIIDVPLEVAASPEELKSAMARLANCEVILMDTAGRSQRDEAKVKELKRFFQSVRPDEVHLVLSSTCVQNVLMETIERFRPLRFGRLLFTKLDEAVGFGVILSCLQKANAKLSYMTTGQDVPEDIEVSEASGLAERIMGARQSQFFEPAAKADK